MNFRESREKASRGSGKIKNFARILGTAKALQRSRERLD